MRRTTSAGSPTTCKTTTLGRSVPTGLRGAAAAIGAGRAMAPPLEAGAGVAVALRCSFTHSDRSPSGFAFTVATCALTAAAASFLPLEDREDLAAQVVAGFESAGFESDGFERA